MPVNKRVLVLNADFTPLGVISWRRAIILAFIHEQTPEKGAQVIDYFPNDYVVTQYQNFPMPAVIRSIEYIKQKKNTIPFSRKNVFIRDFCTCNYCGKTLPITELEYDHVIPRSKWNKKWGTPTTWTNIVTACTKCNRLKADRTPKEAGMKLLKEPKTPSIHQYVLGLSPWNEIPSQWIPYLPPIYTSLYKK
jgi:5-methylcytosine-specific restriction endonuclease McrA